MPARGSHEWAWPIEKTKRFISAWNDGVAKQALRERFACKNPAAMAAALRQRGFNLVLRIPAKPIR